MNSCKSGWRDLAIPFGLLAVLIALLGPWSLPLRGDRSYYLHHALAIARGDVPYRDFFDMHPPLGWLLAAGPLKLAGLSPGGWGAAVLFRGMTILLAAAVVAATVLLGRRLSGCRTGGILAGLFLVGLTPHVARGAAEGELKLLVTAAVVGSLALASSGRPLLAGLAAGAGMMTYYPGLLAAASSLSIAGSGRRRRDLALFAIGLGLPVAGTLLWLGSRDAVSSWYRATLEWVPGYAAARGSNLGGEADTWAALSVAHRGTGAILAAVAGLSFALFLVLNLTGRKRRQSFAQDSLLPPLTATTLLALGYSLLEHGPSDRVLLTPLTALWAAWGAVFLSRLPGGWPLLPRLLRVVAGVTAVAVAVAGIAPGRARPRRAPPLEAQAGMAGALAAAIPPGTGVAFLGDLWPAALADIPLGSPFFHLGPKLNHAAGEGGVLRGVLRDRPDLLLVARPRGPALERLERALSASGYRHAGTRSGFRVWRRRGPAREASAVAVLGALAPGGPGNGAAGRVRLKP